MELAVLTRILQWVLLFIFQPAQANLSQLKGHHPWAEKSFTFQLSKENKMTYSEAEYLCDKEIHCAGVSKYYTDNGDIKILLHSFLPQLPATTYKSKKSFILHRGAIRRGNLLFNGLKSNMTINDAKIFCEGHSKCVAFSYPIYSYKMNLDAPDSITFYSSVNEIDYELKDVWYTLISNDVDRAGFIEESTVKFVIDMIAFPYSTCCERTMIPKISDVKKADTLERIPCSITRDEFIEKYEMARKPVMLVGCNKDWKAVQRWTFDKLSTRFDNSSAWSVDFNGDEEPGDAIWEDVVNAMANKKYFYLFDQADLPHQKNIDEDYDIPTPFRGNNLYGELKNFPDEEYGSFRWFEVSTGNTGTYAHADDVLSTDFWTSLISGYKWWVIFPDSVTKEEEVDCKISGCSNLEPNATNYYASIAVNAAHMPYSNDGNAIHILQRPGETIYIPYGYLHSVYNIGETIGITHNYASVGNLCKVWGELVTSVNPQHWKHVYYNVLAKRQREIVRSTYFWPPESFEDWAMGQDTIYGPLSDDEMVEVRHNCPKFNY